MARIWNQGMGGQCPGKQLHGDFCGTHKDKWQVHGRVDGPIPKKKLAEFLKQSTFFGLHKQPSAERVKGSSDAQARTRRKRKRSAKGKSSTVARSVDAPKKGEQKPSKATRQQIPAKASAHVSPAITANHEAQTKFPNVFQSDPGMKRFSEPANGEPHGRSSERKAAKSSGIEKAGGNTVLTLNAKDYLESLRRPFKACAAHHVAKSLAAGSGAAVGGVVASSQRTSDSAFAEISRILHIPEACPEWSRKVLQLGYIRTSREQVALDAASAFRIVARRMHPDGRPALSEADEERCRAALAKLQRARHNVLENA